MGHFINVAVEHFADESIVNAIVFHWVFRFRI